jgi:hypothetical protein
MIQYSIWVISLVKKSLLIELVALAASSLAIHLPSCASVVPISSFIILSLHTHPKVTLTLT